MPLSFRLERFGWTADHHLELAGRWSGLPDPSALRPTLVVHAASGVQRLEPVPDSIVTAEDARWSVGFPYGSDAADMDRATLVMGEDLLVELPPPVVGGRRFGRQLLRAYRTPRAIEAAAVRGEAPAANVRAAAPPATVRADAPAADRPQEPAPQAPDGAGASAMSAAEIASASPLDLHAALLRTQEELDEARAEALRAEEVVEAANRDTERERRRRIADTERLREALAIARGLADEQLAAERAGAAALRAELAEALGALGAEREQASRLAAELEALRREGSEAVQAEAARAGDRVAAVSEELARVRAELDERSSAAASLSAALEQARHGEQVARARGEALQQRVEAARAAIGDFS